MSNTCAFRDMEGGCYAPEEVDDAECSTCPRWLRTPEARAEAAEAEAARWRDEHDLQAGWHTKLKAEVQTARAEAERLREALAGAHNLVRSVFVQGGTVSDTWREDADYVLQRDSIRAGEE